MRALSDVEGPAMCKQEQKATKNLTKTSQDGLGGRPLAHEPNDRARQFLVTATEYIPFYVHQLVSRRWSPPAEYWFTPRRILIILFTTGERFPVDVLTYVNRLCT